MNPQPARRSDAVVRERRRGDGGVAEGRPSDAGVRETVVMAMGWVCFPAKPGCLRNAEAPELGLLVVGDVRLGGGGRVLRRLLGRLLAEDDRLVRVARDHLEVGVV